MAPSESVSRGFDCINFPLPSPFACAVNKSPPPTPAVFISIMTRLTAVNSSCEQASNPLTGCLAMLKRVKIDRESLVHTAKIQPGSNKNQMAELTSFPFGFPP